VKLNSKSLGIDLNKKPEPVVVPKVELPPPLDEEALVRKIEVSMMALIDPIMEKLNEEEEPEPKKEFACEIIRDDYLFIKEVKIKEL
jgi:hypothetical protein